MAVTAGTFGTDPRRPGFRGMPRLPATAGPALLAGVARRVANAGVDHAAGPVQALGALFDIAPKGNRRNIAILRAARERTPPD